MARCRRAEMIVSRASERMARCTTTRTPCKAGLKALRVSSAVYSWQGSVRHKFSLSALQGLTMVLNSKIEVRVSAISGRGLYAKERITKGETVSLYPDWSRCPTAVISRETDSHFHDAGNRCNSTHLRRGPVDTAIWAA